jgi:flagellar motor protein MotB
MELSVMRAKRMVDELVRRGLRADRFIYKGWGGTKPLAGNDSGQGRAQNRRVEITILE